MNDGRSSDYPSFVVEQKNLKLGAGDTTQQLVNRREQLLESAVSKVPAEFREEFRASLAPDGIDMIYSVPSQELADLVAEIYALDRIIDRRRSGLE